MLGCLLLLVLVPLHATAAQEIDTLALREHTRFLAHDRLEGRGTGTQGERMAARYLARQLQRLGIPGAGPGGSYLQRVPLQEARVDRAASRVAVQRAGRTTWFEAGEDFVPSYLGRGALRDFHGEALFAGTAGLAAEALAAVPTLEGRVIVLLGTLGADAVTLLPDWRRRGAEGVVMLLTEPAAFERYRSHMGATRLLVDSDVANPIWQPRLPILAAGPALSATLLADAPLAPNALDGTQPFAALPLERTIQTTLRADVRELPAANVTALLPGSDPARRGEVVVYTAHYDHLGIGEPGPDGDSIYNGFSDNAAGAAMLLAIAQVLRDSPPARSVLFLFFTGEERGLLGSSYYVTAPVIPLERTVAVINLDAGAPPAPPTSWRVAGGTASTMGELAARVAAEHGWVAESSDARPNSDYWPFLHRGIPAAFLIPGDDWEGVDKEEAERLHLRWDHYHQPSDEWAPDFPFAGLQRYAVFALALGRAAAEIPEPPALLDAAVEGPH